MEWLTSSTHEKSEDQFSRNSPWLPWAYSPQELSHCEWNFQWPELLYLGNCKDLAHLLLIKQWILWCQTRSTWVTMRWSGGPGEGVCSGIRSLWAPYKELGRGVILLLSSPRNQNIQDSILFAKLQLTFELSPVGWEGSNIKWGQ